MKAPFFPILLIACLASVETGWADIVVKEFVEPVSGAVTTGYVFQGSRGMKRLGKRDRKPEAAVSFTGYGNVISLEAIESNESKKDRSVAGESGPLPRFGFGSDYRPDTEKPLEKSVMAPVIPQLVPVYQAFPLVQYAPSVRYVPWYSGYSDCSYRFSYPIIFGSRSTLHFSHGPIFGYPMCR